MQKLVLDTDPNNIGKYGKGLMNSNGEYLLEYAKEFDLYLTNTTFPHRMSHRTTWIGPQRNRDFLHTTMEQSERIRIVTK